MKNLLKTKSTQAQEERKRLHDRERTDQYILELLGRDEELFHRYADEMRPLVLVTSDDELFFSQANYIDIARGARQLGNKEAKAKVFYGLAIKHESSNMRCVGLAEEAGMPEESRRYLLLELRDREINRDWCSAGELAKKLDLENRIQLYSEIEGAERKLRDL